jgi:hypothetical protein
MQPTWPVQAEHGGDKDCMGEATEKRSGGDSWRQEEGIKARSSHARWGDAAFLIHLEVRISYRYPLTFI